MGRQVKKDVFKDREFLFHEMNLELIVIQISNVKIIFI